MASNNRKPVVGISAKYVAPVLDYDGDDEEEHIELPPDQDAGVKAAMKHLKDDKVRRAINVLCALPLKMATDMTAIDKELSRQGMTNYFENMLVDNLRHAFALTRRK